MSATRSNGLAPFFIAKRDTGSYLLAPVPHGIRPAGHSAPRLSPSVAYGPDSSLMPLRQAPHRPNLRTWWAFDPQDPIVRLPCIDLRVLAEPAAADAEVGSAAASRKEHVALGHDGGTAAELTTSASAACTHLHSHSHLHRHANTHRHRPRHRHPDFLIRPASGSSNPNRDVHFGTGVNPPPTQCV